ncbi:tripartite tricarboxylate transporter substrate binding protein [Variovorax sp. Sphag1AA]|uniref:Bug family tripartite tricarboxylate transporter substrate binding protein n=1 Tax=Variovorax sp. Sphag1AA TaxID=2587027 RepID=UPI0016093C8F|nr:tripartite tricarboxylate transporter substrate-binding protein [Variovorax sp. Sphag1AA]MBB3181660.1 tripartite-type tricarboxylate transporter receptor subunit TctC [Variovorax sp. Sphag1AA]
MKLNRRHLLTYGAAVLAVPQAIHAQSKSVIRIVVGFPPGGATDAILRAVADRLPSLLGQPVIIDNKPGVGGRIAADMVLAAPADGLTYMVAPNATPTFQMLVFGHEVRWNIVKDFAPVATLATYPLGMGVANNTGATNVREFIEWVRRNPGKASFGTPGLGGQNHFLGVQLAKTANIDLPVTPYKGTPPMVTDLVGGHVPSAISLIDSMMPHHRSGRIRVIGIFTKERSPLIPEIPTFAEQGVDVTSGEGWTGMWARAGTPPAEIERMQKALQQALQSPEVKDALTQRLWVQPDFRPGAEMDALQRAELAHWAPIIKASGFKPE